MEPFRVASQFGRAFSLVRKPRYLTKIMLNVLSSSVSQIGVSRLIKKKIRERFIKCCLSSSLI